jgi:hypothetical protein
MYKRYPAVIIAFRSTLFSEKQQTVLKGIAFDYFKHVKPFSSKR